MLTPRRSPCLYFLLHHPYHHVQRHHQHHPQHLHHHHHREYMSWCCVTVHFYSTKKQNKVNNLELMSRRLGCSPLRSSPLKSCSAFTYRPETSQRLGCRRGHRLSGDQIWMTVWHQGALDTSSQSRVGTQPAFSGTPKGINIEVAQDTSENMLWRHHGQLWNLP